MFAEITVKFGIELHSDDKEDAEDAMRRFDAGLLGAFQSFPNGDVFDAQIENVKEISDADASEKWGF